MPNAPVHDHVVCTEFNNGEGVLVDLNTKRYYQLNETATLVWKAVESGKPIDEVVSELTTVYAVTPEHAAASVDRLMKEFEDRKLLLAD